MQIASLIAILALICTSVQVSADPNIHDFTSILIDPYPEDLSNSFPNILF